MDEDKYFYSYVLYNNKIGFLTNLEGKDTCFRIFKFKKIGNIILKNKEYTIIDFKPEYNWVCLVPYKYVYNSLEEAREKFNYHNYDILYSILKIINLISVIIFMIIASKTQYFWFMFIPFIVFNLYMFYYLDNIKNPFYKKVGVVVEYDGFCQNIHGSDKEELMNELNKIK